MNKLIKKTAALLICAAIAFGSLVSCKQDANTPDEEKPVQLIYTECSVSDLELTLLDATENVANIKITDNLLNIDNLKSTLEKYPEIKVNLDLSNCTGINTVNMDFSGCNSLLSIIIPAFITSIIQDSFSNCSYLEFVSIPSSVTFIGTKAFKNCTSLKSVTIPSSVEDIDSSAFEGCTGLKSVTLLPGVDSIGSQTFKGCTSLTTVTLSSTFKSIGDCAFEGCTGLTSIYIPAGVNAIGDSAFAGCTSVTSITVAQDNKFFDSRNNCNAVIESGSAELVLGCKNTVIPSSVVTIGPYAFEGCTGLTSISIPANIETIEKYAFGDCTGLTTIVIPANVLTICRSAFNGCSNITSMTFEHKKWKKGDSDVDLTTVNISDFTTNDGAYSNYDLTKNIF